VGQPNESLPFEYSISQMKQFSVVQYCVISVSVYSWISFQKYKPKRSIFTTVLQL